MCDHHNNKRKGTDLRDKEAHSKDHKSWSRRNFLQTIGLAGASSFSLNALPLTSLFGFPLAGALGGDFENRKLVLIRLKGGNDGLNTIVPLYDFDTYRNMRPNLAHSQNDLLNLNDEFAIPNVMSKVRSLWQRDQMRIINSVGYPDHNLSHFTGADIMASGDNNVNENSDGWLARYYTSQNPDYQTDQSTTPPAVKIGGPTSIIFNDSNKVDISANFASADKLNELAQTGTLYNNTVAPDNCYYGDQVLFLRTIANSASLYSQTIFEAYNASTTEAEYTSSLGEQLKLVARLIKGGLKTQLYLVTLDGFDTHVSQNGGGNHLGLLEDLSEAVTSFYEDLNAGDADQDVLSMTYSEFGRRVMENGVSGTDHGTAMPVMIFGPALEGSGIHGLNPNLNDLDTTGNLRFGTDFRSIYATILENWFCIESSEVDDILGQNYDRLNDIGIQCRTTSVQAPRIKSVSNHKIIPQGQGQYRIDFYLERGAKVQLALFTIEGRSIRTFDSQYFHGGEQSIYFSLHDLHVELVPMVYVLNIEGRQSSGQFLFSSK